MPPGCQISESEIAQQYSISRQPVREAFIKLSGEGLIQIRPQRSTVVRRIDCNTVLDARFVREAVESDIVCALAAAPDAALVRDLRSQLKTQIAIAGKQSDRFIVADEQFHSTLAEGAGKASVWAILGGLKSQMDRVRYLSFGLFPQENLVRQHTIIVDRIEQGDVSGAEDAIRQHLREVLRDLPDIIRANPEAFTSLPTDQAFKDLQPRRNP